MKRWLVLLAWLATATAAHAGWTAIDLPRKDVTLRAVSIEGPDRFIVSGSNGTVAITGVAGRYWRFAEIPGGETLDFRGHARLPDGGVVAMSAGPSEEGRAKLFRADDDRAPWRLVHETKAAGAFFDAVAFWSQLNGLVLGDPVDGAWFLLRTSDGGRTWARLAAKMPLLKPGEAAFAASNSALFLGPRGEAWIVSGGGPHGRLFHSRDFGDTWRVAETPIPAGATSGVFGGLALGRGRAVVVGGDYKDELRDAPGIATTANGSALTLSTASGAPRLLEGVGRLDAKTLIAVGPRGTSVSHDDGRSWTQVDTEAFHAIACAAGTCVAAGGKGRVGVWRPPAR